MKPGVFARGLLMGAVGVFLMASVVAGCAVRRTPEPVPPAPSGEKPPQPGRPAVSPQTDQAPAGEAQPGQAQVPFRKDGDRTIFGPISSWARGIDWFWCKDGRRLIVTAENEGIHRLWLIDAATGESKVLREAKGIDAIFPVGWTGDESIVCMEMAGQFEQPTAITVTEFSGDKTATRKLAEFTGRAKRHAMTPDGLFLVVHLDAATGGKIWRLNTSDGSASDLIKGLPIWDGLYPVWFSPDGRNAVMPEPKKDSSQRRLRLLNLVEGRVTSIDPYLEYVYEVTWSPSGKNFAHKVAAGNHKLVETGDMYFLLSPTVRVIDASGKVVRQFSVPQGHLAGQIAWLDDETLVIKEMKDLEDREGPVWLARTGGEMRPATVDEARALERDPYPPYPMSKGASERFKVEVRSWQDQGKAPSQEIIITSAK